MGYHTLIVAVRQQEAIGLELGSGLGVYRGLPHPHRSCATARSYRRAETKRTQGPYRGIGLRELARLLLSRTAIPESFLCSSSLRVHSGVRLKAIPYTAAACRKAGGQTGKHQKNTSYMHYQRPNTLNQNRAASCARGADSAGFQRQKKKIQEKEVRLGTAVQMYVCPLMFILRTQKTNTGRLYLHTRLTHHTTAKTPEHCYRRAVHMFCSAHLAVG